jgi:hypothetical protein
MFLSRKSYGKRNDIPQAGKKSAPDAVFRLLKTIIAARLAFKVPLLITKSIPDSFPERRSSPPEGCFQNLWGLL